MRTLKSGLISILAVGLLAGSAAGVAAQDKEADPRAVSNFYGSLVEDKGSALVIEMTDSRASGELSWTETWTELRSEDGLKSVNWSPMSLRLVNENGSWSGTKMNVGTAWGGTSATDWLLTGEGGYEGFTMMLGADTYQGHEFWGAIVPTDAIPPFPEPPAE